jgi:Protein of unknown function (DUF4013)
MSISDALNYPFRNNNVLKILPIALAYGIILFLTNYGTVADNLVIVCGAGFATLVFTLFISGYYISALRQLQASDENLPEVDLGQNVKDGVLTILAGLIYLLPVIILVIGALVLSRPTADSGGAIFLVCGIFLGAFVLTLALSAAMQVGIVRFAAENTWNALFDLTGNWKIATSNFGTVVGLWARTIVIGVISVIISVVLGAILGAAFPGQVKGIAEPTFLYWLISALVNVASYTVVLFIGLAQYHLIYRFGLALGIGASEKPKNDPYSFGD